MALKSMKRLFSVPDTDGTSNQLTAAVQVCHTIIAAIKSPVTPDHVEHVRIDLEKDEGGLDEKWPDRLEDQQNQHQ